MRSRAFTRRTRPAGAGGATAAEKRRRWRARRGAGWRRLVRFLGMALLVVSVVKELRTPKEQRTWHGTLFGFVPYELRRPNLQRLRESIWDPSSHRLLISRAWGVGWSVNLHEVWVRLRALTGPDRPAALAPAAP